jgi:hypothetical protein
MEIEIRAEADGIEGECEDDVMSVAFGQIVQEGVRSLVFQRAARSQQEEEIVLCVDSVRVEKFLEELQQLEESHQAASVRIHSEG